jgi:hypothetical protein
LATRIAATGLAQPGASGSVSFEARNDFADGFARINLDVPRGLAVGGGSREWHGRLRKGETIRLELQLTATVAGVYHLRGVFWVKEQVGDTFKGASRVKAESVRVSVGGAVEKDSATTVERVAP